jgi:protein TonB
MKSFQLILLCIVCVAKSYGQGGRIVLEITKEKHNTYTTKVIQSIIPGADSSWVQSLEKNLIQHTPDKNRAKKGKYIVSVIFIVDKDGNVSDVECDKNPGFGLCSQVVRILKKTGKWDSGKVTRGQ